METTRKLGPIALIAFIAAIVVAVPIFSATSMINGISIPASSNRFSMMSITGRSTKTVATDWHQLTPANPASGRSVTCRKVVVNPASSHTVLPSIIHKDPLCIQLSIAGGGHYTWSSSSKTPYSALSRKTQQYLQGGGSQFMGLWPGLKLSPSGVLSGTMRFAQGGSNFTAIATGGHERIVADLRLPVPPWARWAGLSPIIMSREILQIRRETFLSIGTTTTLLPFPIRRLALPVVLAKQTEKNPDLCSVKDGG